MFNNSYHNTEPKQKPHTYRKIISQNLTFGNKLFEKSLNILNFSFICGIIAYAVSHIPKKYGRLDYDMKGFFSE